MLVNSILISYLYVIDNEGVGRKTKKVKCHSTGWKELNVLE